MTVIVPDVAFGKIRLPAFTPDFPRAKEFAIVAADVAGTFVPVKVMTFSTFM